MSETHNTLMCFPFLGVTGAVIVGPWKVMGLSEALDSEEWASARYKNRVQKMLELFRYGARLKTLQDPAVVSRCDGGMTGVSPKQDEWRALAATVAFCALDNNDTKYRQNMSFQYAVAEHLDYWQFTVEDSFLTQVQGRRIPILSAGIWTKDHPIADSSVVWIPKVKINEATAAALYSVLLCSSESKRIDTAIRFLVESWRNSSSAVGPKLIPFEFGSIICAQQTAFEVALRFDRRSVSAKKKMIEGLCDLINKAKGMDPVIEKCVEALWVCQYTRYDKDKEDEDKLCGWAAEFTECRNKTVHEGDPLAALSNYESSNIRIQEIIEMADLLLRDVIRLETALATTDCSRETLQDCIASPANSCYSFLLAFVRSCRDVGVPWNSSEAELDK